MNNKGIVWIKVVWELIIIFILTAIGMLLEQITGIKYIGWVAFIVGFLLVHKLKIV